MRIPSQVKVARATSEWLYQELSTLTPEQWETSGACGVWSVAEVVAHLVWVADLYSDGIRRALAGDTSPPAGAGAPPDRATLHAQIAEIAAARHRALGGGVLDTYQETSLTLLDLFEGLTPADWSRPAYHPAGVRPVRDLLTMRIREVAVHGWDVLDHLGRDALLPDGCHEPIVDSLNGVLQGRFVPSARLPEPQRFLFVLTSPLLRLIHLRINGDSFDIDPLMDESGSDAVFTLHPDAYILLFMGRSSWREALDAGIVAATGRQDLARDMPSWFGLR